MAKKKGVLSFLKNVYDEKCPKCKEGYTFEKGYDLLKIPKMNESCEKCGYRFEREPGYFIGAMYLSYALALIQGGLIYFMILLFFPTLSIGWTLTFVLITLIAFAKKNYKWSRILYIYIFPW